MTELRLLCIESNYATFLDLDGDQKTPLHVALANPHVTLRIVQLLLNVWPGSISHRDDQGNANLPIHYLCRNNDLDEAVSIDILTLLLEASPESVQSETLDGVQSIHIAARYGKSPRFLKILVDAHPRSVRIVGGEIRALPIHLACSSDNCRLDSVNYLLDFYPESVNVGAHAGWLPIHHAAFTNGLQKDKVIKYLLMNDPTCASKFADDGQYPLHVVCSSEPNLTAVQLLFNAYPEAIFEAVGYGYTPLKYARGYREDSDVDAEDSADVITFLETQLVYAEKSQDMNTMTTLDQNSWLPLHHALKNKASLGSIKLLVKGNTSGIRIADYNMAFPLHIACKFSSVSVVKYLMEMLDERTRNHLDANKDSILHYACRGGNCEVVKYLLDKQNPYVTERNADKKLPIHLLCQFGLPPNGLEHTDTVHRLLLAYPETVREYM